MAEEQIRGQMSIFDMVQPKQFSCTAIFEDGYAETREYDRASDNLHLWDDLRAKHGILVDFRMNRGGLDDKREWRIPCYGYCDCEWSSLKCYMKRGYIRHNGKWVRKKDGTILRANHPECEWTPKGE